MLFAAGLDVSSEYVHCADTDMSIVYTLFHCGTASPFLCRHVEDYMAVLLHGQFFALEVGSHLHEETCFCIYYE